MEQFYEFVFMFMMGLLVIFCTILATSYANDSVPRMSVFYLLIAISWVVIMCMVKS